MADDAKQESNTRRMKLSDYPGITDREKVLVFGELLQAFQPLMSPNNPMPMPQNPWIAEQMSKLGR